MKSIKEMTQGELAAFVQSHLREKGIDVVLSGGASVCIYSSNRYVSLDLDLVNPYFAKRRALRETMQEIGFHEEGRHFKHPDTQFFVEFPPGPLAVGMEPVKQVNELKFSTGMLRIISPTDCVKDRFIGTICSAWNKPCWSLKRIGSISRRSRGGQKARESLTNSDASGSN